MSDFLEWRKRPQHQGKKFVGDGIIDARAWTATRLKVLFLLKESHEKIKDADYQDGCEWVRDYLLAGKAEGRSTMWKVLGTWAYGLQGLATGSMVPYPEQGSDWTKTQVGEALRSSAFVNVKKSGGGAVSDPEELRRYVDQDWELLQSQLSEIRADIIVCGSTWELIARRFYSATDNETEHCVHRVGSFTFVDFWHPSNRFPHRLSYYALLGLTASAGVAEVGTSR